MKETLELDFGQIVEKCPVALAIYFEDEFIYINSAGVELFRAPSKQQSILGKSASDIIHPDDRQAVEKRKNKLLSRAGLFNAHEEKVICFDGSILEVEVSASSFPLQGKVAIQAVFKDITLQKNTEKPLEWAAFDQAGLSTPLVPVIDQTAILPLVGHFDEKRIDRILETMPARIAKMGLTHLIIECSAMNILDAYNYTAITSLHKMLSFLGVRTVFAGIRPDFARAAVREGFHFSKHTFYPTVQLALHDIIK